MSKNIVGNILLYNNAEPDSGLVNIIYDNGGTLFLLGKYWKKREDREGYDPIWVSKDVFQKKKVKVTEENEYALISTKQTGVLTLTINDFGINNEFRHNCIYQKSAFLSWGYLIRKFICAVLDIETNELQVGYRLSPNTQKHEIFIVETAVNGAGYCVYLNGDTDYEIAQKMFIDQLSSESKASVYDYLVSETHEDCTGSCYDCLRDYYNQNHHSLLNWRLALDLAQLASNESVDLDFSQVYWKEYFTKHLKSLVSKKYNSALDETGGYFYFVKDGHKILITYPFWENRT